MQMTSNETLQEPVHNSLKFSKTIIECISVCCFNRLLRQLGAVKGVLYSLPQPQKYLTLIHRRDFVDMSVTSFMTRYKQQRKHTNTYL